MMLPPYLPPLGLPSGCLANILGRRADYDVGRRTSFALLLGPVLRWTAGQGYVHGGIGDRRVSGQSQRVDAACTSGEAAGRVRIRQAALAGAIWRRRDAH